MNNYEVIGKIYDMNLCKKDDFYFIRKNNGFILDVSGTKEEVKEELKRWHNEIDLDNNYMREIEEHFIKILEN